MADILIADRQHHIHRHSRSIGGLDSGHLRTNAPSIEMVANPAFSFPMKPSAAPADTTSRPISLNLQPTTPLGTLAHKRAASELPTFSFNAADTSGRQDESLTPPRTPDEHAMSSAAAAASKRGHRRGGSEFVGGDSRFGMSSAISSSPTKTTVPSLPLMSESGSPAKRRHAHRRSVAVSSHDLSQIMAPTDKSPRLSSSLPSSPLEQPTATFQRSISTPLLPEPYLEPAQTSSRDESPVRPTSRPRVEFSEDVEIIPRPLSTISSETESSFSTIRGHSVSDSINSVLSFNSSSPASPRTRGQQEPALASIVEPADKRSSVELSKRLEREGEWLKSKSAEQDAGRAEENLDQSPTIQFTPDAARPTFPPAKRQKRQSLGQTFGFDRRRSEPSISVAASEKSRLSAISLQDIAAQEADQADTTGPSNVLNERRFSGHRLKQWVSSKLHRRSRDNINSSQTTVTTDADALERPETAESVDVPGKISVRAQGDRPVAETNLDAVFDALDDAPAQRGARPNSRLTFDTATPSYDQCAIMDADDDDASPILDLDAATEPLRTPPLSSAHRRQLHSDRASKQSSTSGSFVHRRAESEPALMTFAYNRTAAASQKSMEDVFEEDEEEEGDKNPAQAEVDGMGITIVDADEGMSSIRRQSQSARPSTSYTSPTPRLFVSTIERPASIIDEVIIEEGSPVEEPSDGVEVVQAHEEPRAPSLEKLSDSSEASTLLGATLIQDTADATLQASTFASLSPDLMHRQGSFEASRVGTSASSLADTRTTSSCTTGDGVQEARISVDDVPSLTSSRSTVLSTMHTGISRRDISEPIPRIVDPEQLAAKRRKRASIQSLSQLMGGSFGSKTRLQDESRPQTASIGLHEDQNGGAKKRDSRLKKLMFWRSRQSLREAALADSKI